MRKALLSVAVLILALVLPAQAYAQCTNPDGVSGVMVWNADYCVMQVCAGTQWIQQGIRPINCLGGPGDNIPNVFDFTDVEDATLSTQYTDSVTVEGFVVTPLTASVTGGGAEIQNVTAASPWGASADMNPGEELAIRMTASSALDTAVTATLTLGTATVDWVVSTGATLDTAPDPFDFTDVADATTSTQYTDTVAVTGFGGPLTASVSGGGAEIRNNTLASAWGSTADLNPGNVLEIRMTSDANFATAKTANVTFGTANADWVVTTIAADTTPDGFNFANANNAALNTYTASPTTVTISGIDTGVPVSISGDGSPQVRINGGSWVTSGTVQNGQSLEVRLTSANAFSTARTATVDVGGVTDNWSVTTLAQDTTPNGFSFTDQTGVPLNTLRTSNSITINGITGNVNVGVTGQGGPRVRINGGSWVTSGTIQNGQSLQVRLTSANAGTTTRSATVTVGSGSDSWSVTTEDPGPTGCPSIGDVCDDGSIFAGDGNLYVTDVNQSTGIRWSTEFVNTGADSATNGAANQQWIVDNETLSQYPAFQLCENLSRHGHTDWYLPARNELHDVLYPNRSAIGGFPTGYYWSSTEFNSDDAWVVYFNDGFEDLNLKNSNYDVRCVRRN